ncbi:MAG TPA: hypothetical protein VER96_29005 [Polyangiaceae bacterium]|nr:hypothetical protein [Polyangiaceae bacterium]
MTSSGHGAPSPAPASPPAARKKPTQVYQGELDGKHVWLELTRGPKDASGQLGASLRSASSSVSLELPEAESSPEPPSVIPQNFSASDCRLTVADTHPEGLQAACLDSMQGPDFLVEDLPELVLGADSHANGKPFWLRAVDPKQADALATFGPLLQRGQPQAPKACSHSVRIDRALRTGDRTFLGYWTWDVCAAALLSATRAGKAEPGKPAWRETAWLGVVSADGSSVTQVALGQRKFANETLELFDLGRSNTLNIIRVVRDGQDAYPTGYKRETETRLYAAPDRGALTLALGPLSGTESSGNCWGSDVTNDLLPIAAGSTPDALTVRTSQTDRHFHADSCDSSVRTTNRSYRFNPKTNKFDSK